jgi:Ca2+-binding RTX toxin-like protein
VVITALDDAPRLTLSPIVSSLKETTSTAVARQVASINVIDPDGGPRVLSLSGADAALFTISGNKLLLKAGAKLDFETNPRLDVTVNVDDGAAPHPDASASRSIAIGNVAEIISGNKKDNVLKGTLATEIINGKGGDDTIKAGIGDDTVRGGRGADVVTGGKGEDVFVFKPGDLPRPSHHTQEVGGLAGAYDLIRDFKPRTDVIDLSAIDANSHRNGNQKFHFEGRDELSHSRGELVYELYGRKATGYTIVMGDTNGDGAFDFRVVLKGHHTLHSGDFIL